MEEQQALPDETEEIACEIVAVSGLGSAILPYRVHTGSAASVHTHCLDRIHAQVVLGA